MDEHNIIVGLDIGTTKIACIVGRKNEDGKIEILGMGKSISAGVLRGVVTNIDQTVQAIQEAVKLAEETSGVEIQVVNVGIAGQHIKSLQHHSMRVRDSADQAITEEDLALLIDDVYKIALPAGEEIIHAIPQEFTIDQIPQIKDPVGMVGACLEADLHVITGDMRAIKNIHTCVEKAGLAIHQLILEPLASADAVLTEEEREAGVAMVDIGGGTTDIAIFYDGIIRHTAVIPFGGNIITDDIKTGCGIIQKYAEELKVRYGSAIVLPEHEAQVINIPGFTGRPPREISMKNLAAIINSRVEEIIEQVAYEIHNSGYANQLAAGIVLTGGGADLKNIKQLFDYVTGMSTRIGFPAEYLEKTKTREEHLHPKFSTGVGLMLKNIASTREVGKKQMLNIKPKKRVGETNFLVHKIKGLLNAFISEDLK